MSNLYNVVVGSAVLCAGATFVAGCDAQNASPTATSSANADDWKTGLDADVAAALSKLSDADRTAALSQKVCPVTDEPLGSMGTPLKVTVEGRDVFLCCGGCEDQIKNEPAKYLAKLNDEN